MGLFILITSQPDNIWLLWWEVMSWSLLRVKRRNLHCKNVFQGLDDMESDLFGGSLGKKNTVSKSPKPVKAASEQKKINANSKLPPATSSTTESAKSKMASASSSSSTKSISVLGSHLFTDTFFSVTVKWQLFKSDNLKRSCASNSASECRPLPWMTKCWWSIFYGLAN